MNLVKVKTALISVYYKADILPLAEFLAKKGVKIISTGGSFKLLKENGIDAIEISDFTGFPEMMSGRLKTLHPKIHGGLLGREQDTEMMKDHGIEKIDLVIVNLYPFEETVLSSGIPEDIIEKIDIGGPSMVRSSAKNYKYTCVVTDPKHYQELKSELENNNMETTLKFREKCAGLAFALTGFYDSVISSWFKEEFNIETEVTSIPLRKTQTLRYGENPHQKAAFYEIPLSKNSFASAKQLQGKELSYNNIADADAALEAVSAFNEPATCIVKHANPCGLAFGKTIEESYDFALSCDSRSAFGGIVAFNRDVNEELAKKLKSHFYEVIVAPKFSPEAIIILSTKVNLRLLEIQNYKQEKGLMVKNIHGGILMQSVDNVLIDSSSLELASGSIDGHKMDDLIFSFKTVKFFKSNAIVITEGSRVVSFGCGQTSRVDAMEIACKKLATSDISAEKCVLSSDAFFPFIDNLELAKSYGIQTFIAPSGSMRDEEIKAFAIKNGLNFLFVKTRHFRH